MAVAVRSSPKDTNRRGWEKKMSNLRWIYDFDRVKSRGKIFTERTSVCVHVEIFHPDAKQGILDLGAGA